MFAAECIGVSSDKKADKRVDLVFERAEYRLLRGRVQVPLRGGMRPPYSKFEMFPLV